MCWAVGSVQEAAQARCRMCRLLDVRGDCQHETTVCTQRKMHPDFDVRHYVNAEVRWTNACGYCKWAKANGAADPKQNRGWPGCCRPPTSKEWVMVKDPGAASVIARLHEVAIPDSIRAALEQAARQMQQLQPDGTGSVAIGGPRPPPSAPVAIPSSKSHVDSAPQSSGSLPNGALPLVPPGMKTRLADEQALSAALSPPEERKQPPARRLSVGSSAALASAVVHREPVHATPTPRSNAPQRPGLNHKKSGSLQQITAALSASSIARQSAQVFSDSDSSSTVRSEFTDYLSDESEAELQRLALERAQLKREEDEFKAARARLAHVDTTPPVEWQHANGAPPTRPRQGSSGSGGSGGSAASRSSPKQAQTSALRPNAPAHTNSAPRVTTSVSEIQRAVAAQNRANTNTNANPARGTGGPPPRQPIPQAQRIR